MKLQHIVKVVHKPDRAQLVISTHNGPCMGTSIVGEWPIHTETQRLNIEQRAYILAKQIGAQELEGVSQHTLGFWLTWQATLDGSEDDK